MFSFYPVWHCRYMPTVNVISGTLTSIFGEHFGRAQPWLNTAVSKTLFKVTFPFCDIWTDFDSVVIALSHYQMELFEWTAHLSYAIWHERQGNFKKTSKLVVLVQADYVKPFKFRLEFGSRQETWWTHAEAGRPAVDLYGGRGSCPGYNCLGAGHCCIDHSCGVLQREGLDCTGRLLGSCSHGACCGNREENGTPCYKSDA